VNTYSTDGVYPLPLILERWERLSRMLDGKRTMVRLDKILHNPKDFCLESEYGALAGHIYNLGLVDKQLHGWLSSIN